MKKICTWLLSTALIFSLSTPVHAALVVPAHEPDPATVKAAIAEFKNLPKKERKEKIKEAKKQLKQVKKDKKAGKNVELAVLIILCFLLPPLAVYLHQETINSKFWISLLLTLLFILPGVIYSLIVVLGEA